MSVRRVTAKVLALAVVLRQEIPKARNRQGQHTQNRRAAGSIGTTLPDPVAAISLKGGPSIVNLIRQVNRVHTLYGASTDALVDALPGRTIAGTSGRLRPAPAGSRPSGYVAHVATPGRERVRQHGRRAGTPPEVRADRGGRCSRTPACRRTTVRSSRPFVGHR